MESKEKIIAISDIFNKYGFCLSNTNLKMVDEKDAMNIMLRNHTLDDISKIMAKQSNCIIEIIRVLYNVGEV